MTKKELLKRLSDIEWEDFEVKKAQTDIPKSSRETVSAFCNSNGGWLIFGVEQEGKYFNIIGVDNPERIEQDFVSSLRGGMFNMNINIECKKYNFDNKTVIAFYIPLSSIKPIYFNNIKNSFKRVASGDQRASEEEINAWLRDQSFGSQSSKIIQDSSVKDLNNISIERYRDYLTRYNPDNRYTNLTKKEFLQKLQVVVDDKLTYSGLLFFGKHERIQRTFPNFMVDYLEIPGTSYSDATTRYTFRLDEQENLWEYFFTIFEKLRKHIDVPFKMTPEGFADENYPHITAIREALINLLMHSDYFSEGNPRIRVFTDRIEFYNPGPLPKPLSEIIKKELSLPRNPIITKLFRVVKLAENAGYGFDKMFKGWTSYYSIEPKVDFSSISDYKIEFFTKIKEESESYEVKIVMTETRRIIIEQIKLNSKITAKELAEIIGVTSRTIENHIAKFKEIGIIGRKGGDFGGEYVVLNDTII